MKKFFSLLATLLVLAPGDLPFRQWLQRYQALCTRLGPLPPARSPASE